MSLIVINFQVTGFSQNSRKYKVQFFDSSFNLLPVPEAKVQEFSPDDVEDTIPEKYKEEWKKGMVIAAKAIENAMDESDSSDKASLNSVK